MKPSFIAFVFDPIRQDMLHTFTGPVCGVASAPTLAPVPYIHFDCACRASFRFCALYCCFQSFGEYKDIPFRSLRWIYAFRGGVGDLSAQSIIGFPQNGGFIADEDGYHHERGMLRV